MRRRKGQFSYIGHGFICGGKGIIFIRRGWDGGVWGVLAIATHREYELRCAYTYRSWLSMHFFMKEVDIILFIFLHLHSKTRIYWRVLWALSAIFSAAYRAPMGSLSCFWCPFGEIYWFEWLTLIAKIISIPVSIEGDPALWSQWSAYGLWKVCRRRKWCLPVRKRGISIINLLN